MYSWINMKYEAKGNLVAGVMPTSFWMQGSAMLLVERFVGKVRLYNVTKGINLKINRYAGV